MANKGDRLRELTKEWREEADRALVRPGTTSGEDKERHDTLDKCADDVDKILDDHKAD